MTNEETTMDYKTMIQDEHITEEGKTKILIASSITCFESFIEETKRKLIEKEINGE